MSLICLFLCHHFCTENQQTFDILDFFIIWSCLVFRSRILVLCGRGGIFLGEGWVA